MIIVSQFTMPLKLVSPFHNKLANELNYRDQRGQTGGDYYDNWIKLVWTQTSIGLTFGLKPSEQ